MGCLCRGEVRQRFLIYYQQRINGLTSFWILWMDWKSIHTLLYFLLFVLLLLFVWFVLLLLLLLCFLLLLFYMLLSLLCFVFFLIVILISLVLGVLVVIVVVVFHALQNSTMSLTNWQIHVIIWSSCLFIGKLVECARGQKTVTNGYRWLGTLSS